MRLLVMRAGSALPRVHSMLSVLAARELLQRLAFGNVAGPQVYEGMISASQAVLCNLLCLCRRAQLSAAAIAACPSVLMTLLWILLSFYRCILLARSVLFVTDKKPCLPCWQHSHN